MKNIRQHASYRPWGDIGGYECVRRRTNTPYDDELAVRTRRTIIFVRAADCTNIYGIYFVPI